MADTIREQILSVYKTRLASWTTANGFNYNCGVSAKRAIQNIEPSNLPACVLWPKIEEVTNIYGQNGCEMKVRIEAFEEIGGVNPSVVQEKLLGDAIKIMTDPSVSVSSKIDDIAYVEGGPASIAKAEEKITAIYADFIIKYSTLIGDPYSQ